MSSNVGLSTPRGSGTSGYVQRNGAFIKPRAQGYGAPYPPATGANGPSFKQRLPDKQILEHDRQRAIEVQVMEERERLEEENERIEEKQAKKGKNNKKAGADVEEGEEEEERVLKEEEIEERCEALRKRLLRELEDVEKETDRRGIGKAKQGDIRDRRQLKSYQVHELAEAKIEESERLRRALGIREDRETGEISSSRGKRREERD